MPPNAGLWVMVRVEVRVPVLQVTVQGAQLNHCETMQLMGHGTGSHWAMRCSEGQACPPYCGDTVIERDADFEAAPQEALQPVHAVHCETTQDTGHGCGEQVSVRDSSGQGAPPYKSLWVIWRLDLRVPPPHVALHEDQSVQAETLQSTGQADVRQTSVRVSAGQGVPRLVSESTT